MGACGDKARTPYGRLCLTESGLLCAPARDAGAPIFFLVAAAARLASVRACLSKGRAAPVDGTAALGPAAARFAVGFGLTGLRLVVFRCASAKGITQTASSRVT